MTGTAPIAVPEEARQAIVTRSSTDAYDQVFPLLTASPYGPIDVCLLSRVEVRTTATTVRVAAASRSARRNLLASPRATLLVVACDAAYYLSLELRLMVEGDDAWAAELALIGHRRDSLGIELHPMSFRTDSRLAGRERWDRTERLLRKLDAALQRSEGRVHHAKWSRPPTNRSD